MTVKMMITSAAASTVLLLMTIMFVQLIEAGSLRKTADGHCKRTLYQTFTVSRCAAGSQSNDTVVISVKEVMFSTALICLFVC